MMHKFLKRYVWISFSISQIDSGVPHGHNGRRNSPLAYQQGNNNNQDYQVLMAVPLTAADVLSPFIQIRAVSPWLRHSFESISNEKHQLHFYSNKFIVLLY